MKTISKKDKLDRAIYQALKDYDRSCEKIEEVIISQIKFHTPSDVGYDSMEEWESVSGTATIRTSTIIENGITSVVSNFYFSADVEYTDEKEFKCKISCLIKMQYYDGVMTKLQKIEEVLRLNGGYMTIQEIYDVLSGHSEEIDKKVIYNALNGADSSLAMKVTKNDTDNPQRYKLL